MLYRLREGRRTRRSTFRLSSVLPSSSPHADPTWRRATAEELTPATVVFGGSSPMSVSLPSILPLPPPSQFSHLADFLLLVHDSPYWPLTSSLFPCNGTTVASAILGGTAVGVCDGSYMPSMDAGRAAASWVIVDSLQPHLNSCFGHTLVSGTAVAINSYRAELQGLHALLLAVEILCSFHHITEGRITIYCDNLQAVRLAKLSASQLRPNLSHLDLLRAISHMASSLPVTLSFEHVAGHQDDSTPWIESLPLEAQLNILCDSRAKEFLLESSRLDSPCPGDRVFQHESLRILINGSKVYTDVGRAAMDQAASLDYRAYLIKRQVVPAEAFSCINWDAIGDALSSLSDSLRMWAVKFVSDFSGTGTRMHQRGLWSSPFVPVAA